jgi:hypothetical protein
MKSENLKFILGLLVGFILTFFFIEIKNSLVTSNSLDKIIKILSRQSARWSTAAKQDLSPLIAVLHANYGTGYLWALKDIATAKQIKIAANIDIDKFTQEIVKIQDETTIKMIEVCPNYAPEKTYLSKIGGENRF